MPETPLSDHTVRKAVTQRDLLRWAIFQYLIGNSDAHGKNVSFFAEPEGMSLARSTIWSAWFSTKVSIMGWRWPMAMSL